MSEQAAEATATEAEGQEETTTEGAPKPSETVDYWKKRARENEAKAKANAAAAQRLAEFEESQKSEAQKLQEARDAAERRASEAERANLRYRVAVTKQLPPELVDRLRGDTEEEMSADADSLLALVKPAAPSYDGGGRTTAGAPADMNALIRRAAGHG